MKLSEQVLEAWQVFKEKIVQQHKQIQQLKAELEKERGWWDKWINDPEAKKVSLKTENNSLPVFVWQSLSPYQATSYSFKLEETTSSLFDNVYLQYFNHLNSINTNPLENLKMGKLMIKAIYRWYLNDGVTVPLNEVEYKYPDYAEEIRQFMPRPITKDNDEEPLPSPDNSQLNDA